MSAHCIIYDTEFTAWPGSQAREWSGKGEHRELVQIAAIRVDRATLQEAGHPFNVLIRPKINSDLSPYFTGLTGITQADINQDGIAFEQAYTQFRQYCDGLEAIANGADHEVIAENLGLYGLKDRLPEFQGSNLALWLEGHVPEIFEIEDICSGTLARAVGADFNAPAHNALNDVRSILAALHHLHFVRGYPNAMLEVEKRTD